MDRRATWSVGFLMVLMLAGGLSSCENNARKGVCYYAGVSYAAQDQFLSIDGCNSCSCSSDGTVGCTKRACSDGSAGDGARDGLDARGETSSDGASSADGTPVGDGAGDTAPSVCSLETSYRFYDDGGLRAYYDDSRIAPPRTHTLTRKMTSGTVVECGYEIPCSPGSVVDLSSIQKAIAHPDVQEAMAKATPPHYGGDPRPVDGTVWVFERADGRGFSLGTGNVPAGLRGLETLLRQLTTETRAAPQCAALRP